MMWRVNVAGPAQKALSRLPEADRDRLVAAIDAIAINPYTGDIRKLGGDTYRRRVGSYRIFFDIVTALRAVHVTAITRRTSTTYR